MVLLTSHLGSGQTPTFMDSAVVMEITHLATLYHDDVMDEASTRRGVDAAHVVWGNNIAILTGDLLFARAANIVSHLGTEALQLQAQVFRAASARSSFTRPLDLVIPIRLQHYLDVVRDKTGSLFLSPQGWEHCLRVQMTPIRSRCGSMESGSALPSSLPMT